MIQIKIALLICTLVLFVQSSKAGEYDDRPIKNMPMASVWIELKNDIVVWPEQSHVIMFKISDPENPSKEYPCNLVAADNRKHDVLVKRGTRFRIKGISYYPYTPTYSVLRFKGSQFYDTKVSCDLPKSHNNLTVGQFNDLANGHLELIVK